MEKPSDQIQRRIEQNPSWGDIHESFAFVRELLDQLWEEVERLKRERAEKV